MQKCEVIYREILDCVFERKNTTFTQLGLAKKFGFSLSTVNNALNNLFEIGAVEKHSRFFKVIDSRKIAYYWATIRKLKRDVIYSTFVNAPILEIEKRVPNECIFSCFSAFKLTFNYTPADYRDVYIYANENDLNEVKKRFPENKKTIANLIVLRKDNGVNQNEMKVVSKSQMFVDLWNLKDWQASEFIDDLEYELKLKW